MFIGIGVILLLFFLAFLIAAVMAGRPSLPARIIVTVLDLILVLLSLSSLRNGITIGLIVFWVLQAVIIYGMVIHGTRTQAVARTAP